MNEGFPGCGSGLQRESDGSLTAERDRARACGISEGEIFSRGVSVSAECSGFGPAIVMPVMTYADLLPYLMLPMAGSF